jgi:drug/metabolite transporter (DMT)-like permease
MNRDRANAVAALLFLSLVWGYNWVLMKQALEYAGPFDFAAWRTGIGAATLFLILALQGRLRRPPRFGGLAILGFFQIAIFTAVTMLALVSGDPGKMSILVYTMPVWSMAFAWLMLGQKPRRAHLFATAGAFLGVLCMAQPWRAGIRLSAVYALGGAAAWGFSSAYATRLRQTGLDNLSITAWSMGLGSAMLVVIAYFTPSPAIRWDSHFALILFYNAVLAMAVAWLLWAYVLERLSIMAASLGVLAVPLIGSLSSTLQLGERYSAIELVGMGAVTLSMAAVYWRPAKRSHPESITHDNLNQLRAP